MLRQSRAPTILHVPFYRSVKPNAPRITLSTHHWHRSFSQTYTNAMPPKQKYTDPKLRDEVKEDIKQSDKGGEPGQWSARKAQMMAKEYKARGGSYNQPKSQQDESQKDLERWGDEEWQTKEGSGEAKQSDGSRKRYLPKKAWEQMSEKEKEETDEKKQSASKSGKQFVGNTGKAKAARKEVEKEAADTGASASSNGNDDDSGRQESPKRSAKKGTSRKSHQTKQDNKKQSRTQENGSRKAPKSEKTNNDEGGKTPASPLPSHSDPNSGESEEGSSHKENQSRARGQKRSRKQDSGGKADDGQSQPQQPAFKRQKKGGDQTIGSKHDKAAPPATQGSNTRLPRKGQKNVHWKAMPGWVEGEVVEIVKKEKQVEGKTVKASKDSPQVVLKSKSSGKICVHKADNVYFD